MTAPTLRAAHRTSTVFADDGTALAVHEYGPQAADLTVVFVHGHCLRSAAWQFQLSFLHRRFGQSVRLIAYDQRGHGDSSQASMDTYTVDQLGRDLADVLRATRADKTILVGHSMGGMAALAYVRHNPGLVGTQVVGLALIATAAGDLARHGIGRSLNSPALHAVRALVHHAPLAAGTIRTVGQQVCRPLIHGFGYGLHTSPRLRTLGTAMLTEVPIHTMVGFLDGLRRHDEHAALRNLTAIPVAVVCGDNDLMTPPVHSRAIAAALPAAELTMIPGAGHMVLHERHTQVGTILAALIRQVRACAPVQAPASALAGVVGVGSPSPA